MNKELFTEDDVRKAIRLAREVKFIDGNIDIEQETLPEIWNDGLLNTEKEIIEQLKQSKQ